MGLLRTYGLKLFLEFSCDIYPYLVRVFYCTLKLQGNNLCSWIKMVLTVLSFVLIDAFLDLSSEGSITHPEITCVWEGFNKKKVY